MIHQESKLQQTCVKWFRLQYPQFATLLFAVPNGGSRNPVEAAIMKGEGVTAGVADLILLLARQGYNALCIEMKAGKGRQEPSQKKWQEIVEKNGNRYVICRSFEDFKSLIIEYLTTKAL